MPGVTAPPQILQGNINMENFTPLLNDIKVASTEFVVNVTDSFNNITGAELLKKIKQPQCGQKEGSHFLRTSLIENSASCLPRSDINSDSEASILIIDCDKHIDVNGEEIEGAPDPKLIHGILQANNVTHVLYGSYSHYVGNKGNRYRIIIPTKVSYSRKQLEPTIESIIELINSNLDSEPLASAKENCTWAQPWYYPRKPMGCITADLYFEYLEGEAIDVMNASEIPPINKIKRTVDNNSVDGGIMPITAFNQQYSIINLLTQYGYKLCCRNGEYEKWLSPHSTSGQAGITVKDNKIFSHHNDALNDGYWHDAFDLMSFCKGLNEKEAVKHAAQITLAPDGRTVDEYNKSQFKKSRSVPGNSTIIHSEMLNTLLEKIPQVDFKKIANLEEEEKLKNSEIHVIVIEKILEAAKINQWGLCRNYDFIYVYNGEYWNHINEDELKTFLGQAAEKMGIENLKARHHNFKGELFKQFLSSAYLPKPNQPKDSVFINLKNGTLEITPIGTSLKLFNANDFMTYQLSFGYDPDAQAPLFHQYLDRVLPDKKLQKILAEYLGYIFVKTSTLKLEKTLLLYGSGANGKSVCYEIVRQLLGAQNTSEYSLQSLTNGNGYYRAMLANKLLNYASEINGKLEAAIFKQLVSGETVEARLPYGNPHSISDYAKLMFNCNELPSDVEHTDAYFRRFLIIPFNVTIPENEQDKQLANKIVSTELSGVLNWVLEGLKRLLETERFTESDVVNKIRSQYEKESDSVALFLDEEGYQSSDEHWIELQNLFKRYRPYCADYCYRSVSYKNFKKRLERAKIIIEKKNCGLVAFVISDTGVLV